jgi:hypothetical protein
LHVPTRLLIAWIAFVAHTVAHLPLGEVRGGELAALAVALACAVAAHHRARRSLRVVAFVLAAAALVAPIVAVRTTAPVRVALQGGELWQSGGHRALVVLRRARAADLLQELRRRDASSLDVVVVTTRAGRGVADDLSRAVAVGAIVEPGDVETRAELDIGDLRLELTPMGGELFVTVTASERGPPV